MRDIVASKKRGKVNNVIYRRICFDGEYNVLHSYKYSGKQPLTIVIQTCTSILALALALAQ